MKFKGKGAVYLVILGLFLFFGMHSAYASNQCGTQKWRFQTGNGIISSPAIGPDGTIYVGSGDGFLYAIDNGTLKWKFETNNSIISSTAIGPDGTIYVGSYDHYLYAIIDNGTNGVLKWSCKTGGAIESSPAIGPDGTIYVGSEDNYLYAINPDGTLKWSYKTGGYVLSSPAIGPDGTIYVGSEDNYLYAINPGGTLKWKYKTGNWVDSSPAIGSDGTIYVGSYDDNLSAIIDNGTKGVLKWSYKTGDYVRSSPAIGPDGTIYVGSSDAYLYAINSDSHGPANSPWPMFHHDLMHIGRAGVKVIGYPTNRLIELSADNATIDNASASSMTQPSNAPPGVNVKNKIGLYLTLAHNADSTRITISHIPTLSNMVFYKYVNSTFIDLIDNQSCGNCNFTRTDNQTTHTTTISFTLTDGGVLDADGTVNGTIQDPVVIGTTNEPPIIDSFTATPMEGVSPLKVTFVCKAHDPDGSVTSYHWDFNGDGKYDNTTSVDNITHTYTKAGTYTAKCLAADNGEGKSLVHKVSITVERPIVEHTLNLSPMPLNGSETSPHSCVHPHYTKPLFTLQLPLQT